MLKPWLWIAALLVLLGLAWQAQGWAGVAMVASTGLFLVLLQFHRAMSVLRRASARPIGSVASAVMLQSRLRAGLTTQQLVQLAGSLGERVEPAPAGADEGYRWADPGGAEVRVRLRGGKLVDWVFSRPDDLPAGASGGTPGSSPPSSS